MHLITILLTFNLRNVTETDVAQIIRTVKPSRVKNIYGMDRVMLKDLGTTPAHPLTKLINCSFSQGIFPSVLKSGAIIPIFKNGDPSLHQLQTNKSINSF